MVGEMMFEAAGFWLVKVAWREVGLVGTNVGAGEGDCGGCSDSSCTKGCGE